jgi:hypothetical protein
MTLLFVITIIWLAYWETYRKMIKVEINNSSLYRLNLFGKKINIQFDTIDGYQTQVNSLRIGNYEELKILKDGKPIVVISEFYHKNYLDIKKRFIEI